MAIDKTVYWWPHFIPVMWFIALCVAEKYVNGVYGKAARARYEFHKLSGIDVKDYPDSLLGIARGGQAVLWYLVAFLFVSVFLLYRNKLLSAQGAVLYYFVTIVAVVLCGIA